MSDKRGPLVGIRVLELGTMIAGPVAATLLGDLGAEVIKIEQPNGGDPIRQTGALVDGESLYWNVEGRNKKSITIDLRQEAGQEIVRKLVAHADVLIENFRPGTMNKWNLGYQRLKHVNPKLVMLSVSGYGQTGPNAALPSYDRVALAFSGYLNMTGYPDRPPVRPGTAIADYQTALFGAFSVMVALFHRDARGGTGQQLDVSLFETIFRFTDTMVTAFDKVGLRRERRGNIHFAAAPGDHYEMADGRFLAITISADGVFARLCKAMKTPDHCADPKFATHQARVENYAMINGIVAQWIKSNPACEVLTALQANAVPHSLIYSVSDILEDPHYAARNVIETVENPRIGPLKMPTAMPKMSETPPPLLRAAPMLGEDTLDILKNLLGMSAEQACALKSAGVI